MIDDDDSLMFLLAWPVLGPVTLILCVVGFLYLCYAAAENERGCEARACEYGRSRLLDGECVCAGEPKK